MNFASDQHPSYPSAHSDAEALQQELGQLRLRLKHYELRQQKFLDILPQAFWIMNADGILTAVSQTCCEMVGMSAAQAIGQDIFALTSILIPSEDGDRFRTCWQQAQERRQPLSFSGLHTSMQLKLLPIGQEEEQVQEWMGVYSRSEISSPSSSAQPQPLESHTLENPASKSHTLEIPALESHSLETPASDHALQPEAQRTPLSAKPYIHWVDTDHYAEAVRHAEQGNPRPISSLMWDDTPVSQAFQRLRHSLDRPLTDLPALLQAMLDIVCEAIPNAQFGLIVLKNPKTQLLELTTTTGVGHDRLQTDRPFQAGRGLLGQVFLSESAQIIQGNPHNVELLGEVPAALAAVGVGAAATGKLGVIAVGNWEDVEAFDASDCQLLEAFGERAAIAIYNAQLIDTLERNEERLAFQNALLAQQNWELAQKTQKIQHQNLQLQEAADLKSKFLAIVSHELRTPMNAIIGFSQLLLRQRSGKLNRLQANMLQRISDNGKHLLVLIEDILDLSNLETGYLELRSEEFNLVYLIVTTLEELRALAEEKGLTVEIQTNLCNPYVRHDKARLKQVIANLVSNAIKFTESGSILVKLQELPQDRIQLVVQDTGIGIEQTELQHIFEEFRQVDQTASRRYSGIGLGLAIANWLVRLMKGKIEVESELGWGSIFRIELPRKLPRAIAPS